MATLEERISALEREVTALKLERLTEQRKAERNVAATEREFERVNQDLTMLLGLATVQQEKTTGLEQKVDALQEDVTDIQVQLHGVNQRLEHLEATTSEHTNLLNQHTKRFDAVDQRLDRLEVVSNAQTVVLSQHTDLLTQILARLPEKPGSGSDFLT